MFTINTYEYDCTKKCKSRKHGRCITTALTKKSIPDDKLAAYIAKTCRNFTEILDFEGRSALHLASSVNRYAIVEWLLNQGASINKKDTENGYSPLHRALFYGCIDCAVLLLRYGTDLELLDDESRNTLQLICKPSELDYFRNIPPNNDCLVWGTNKNYNLGIENIEGTNSPQIVDVFRKQNICIVSVALSTYHSLFIDKKGDVYAVGHGNGGRLGNANEKSLPSPKRIKLPTKKSDEKAIGISCSKNHSLVLSSTSAVYSCGLNTDQQLGIKPPPEMLSSFKEISAFAQYGVKDLLEVVAKDFCSIAFNVKEVYVWGRNRGQFGIKDDTSHVLLPRMLPLLTDKKILILKATNSAIACYTEYDNWMSKQIVLFSNYRVRTFRTPASERVLNMCITGGDCDKGGKADNDNPIKLLILMASNGLYIWYDDIQLYVRCVSLPRSFQINDISMKSNKFMILSNGYVYSGTGVKVPVYKAIDDFEKFNERYTDLCSKSKFRIDVKRIPNIDRAFAIFCDDDFESFATLEENSRKYFILPQLGAEEYTFKNLLHEASELDGVHDIIFHVDNEIFPAHKFIVYSRAKGLMKIVQQFSDKDIYFNYKNLTGKIFELILKHIYTNYFLSEEDLDDVQQSLGPKTNASRQEILTFICNFAVQFGLHELANSLKCSNDILDGTTAKQKSRFLRLKLSSLPELYDVTIKCAGDQEIKVHKCVLVARLEYFNLMLNNRWSETRLINLTTIPLDYMTPLIEFLYTADVEYFRKQKFSESFLYNMIVICDQFFVNRLRRVCEILLLEKISIRKCGEMLEFACLYNCELLERGCLEFICYNLARVLEQKILEGYDFAVLSKISQFYRELFKEKLDFRVITPASDSIDDDLLFSFTYDFNIDLECKAAEVEKSKIKNKSKLSKSAQFKRNYEKEAISAMKEKHSLEFSLPKPDTSATLKNQLKTEIDNVCDQIHAKSESWMKVHDKKDGKRKSTLAAIKTNVIMKEEKKPESDFTNLSMVVQVNSPKSTTSTTPTVSFSLNEEPVNRQSYTSLGDFTPLKTEKLSQKQRKRLSSETKTDNSLICETKPIPIPKPQQNSVWGIVSPPSDHSFADIMKSPENSFPDFQSISPEKNKFSNRADKLKTPPKSFTNNTPPANSISYPGSSIKSDTSSFTKILADERKQKEYYERIKSKSLILTQIEETAISELKAFYNVDNVDDENITVERKSLPVTMNFAVWQHY